jgi:hypothetical protein
MDEGYLEAVNAELRLIAIRYRDGGSYCVARLLGRRTPRAGQWVRGRLRGEGGRFTVEESGESAAISVVKAQCSRSEAMRLLDLGE